MALRLGRKVTVDYRKSVEREIARFKDDHYLWHKHVTNVSLDPHQVGWCRQIDTRGDSHLLIGSRRIRKSFTVASYLLKEAATKANSEINVHSPALEQSKRNLRYMTDMVLNSEILLAYIDQRLGEGLGKEHIEFMNGSRIQAKGQASSIDGLGATHQWLEEFDDMEWNTVLTRIYPTGSQIKPDFDYGNRKGCLRLITGTIKGVGNIHKIEHPERGVEGFRFNVLTKLTAHHGIAMGIIPEQDIILARTVLFTPEQYARTYLVLYVESANFYPDKYVRLCANTELLPHTFVYGEVYDNVGEVCVGIDCGGAGSSEEASNWAITFTEKVGNKIFWLYTKEWSANTQPDVILNEMSNLIQHFRPITGFGDAFDSTFLFDLNVELKRRNVTKVDVKRFENKQGSKGWDNWYIKPIRFHGPNIHLMHERMAKYIYSRTFVYPTVVDDPIELIPEYNGLSRLIKQFGNVKAERSKAGYNVYNPLNLLLGLDSVDSCIASIWAQQEIKVDFAGFGAIIPPMEIAGPQKFSPLGPNFLNDTRKFNKNDVEIFNKMGLRW